MRQVTIKDVANQAGVSTTTVSHVINNTRFVAEPTRDAVEKAMSNLGYHPNTLARSLRSGETKTIGLMLPDGSNPFFADMARRIEDLGFKNGYSVILCNSDNDLEKQCSYIDTLIAKQVDGVIFISAGESKEDLQRLANTGTPVVVVDRNIPLSLADMILLDNEQAGYDGAKHLIDLGHTRIALITGPTELAPSHMRECGFRKALREIGIEPKPEYIVQGDFTMKSGSFVMEKLLLTEPLPTAVFALNDMMAIGAMATARRNGYRIPEDFSFVGFDNIELASAIVPSLTTIAQPVGKIAETAVERLLEKVQLDVSSWENEEIILPAKIIVRDSTRSILLD